MFGIGMTEIIVILVIALIIIGPDRIPDLAKALGKGMAEFRRAAEDFKSGMYSEMKMQAEKKRLLENVDKQAETDQAGKLQDDRKGQGAQEHDDGLSQDTRLSESMEGPIADEAPVPQKPLKDKPTQQRES